MTAVEWLVNQFDTTINYTLEEWQLKIKQAKEMEREQIMDAFIFSKDPFGLSIGNSHTIKKAEDYYNTTFKSE